MSETVVFLRYMATREDERNEPVNASNLRFIANELTRLQESDKALARVWKAMGIAAYTGKAAWEHVAELKAIVDLLPKCWRLRDGKLVQDHTVVYGERIAHIEDGHVEEIDVGDWQKTHPASVPYPVHAPTWHCYDSPEAAEAAEAARKEADGHDDEG